MFLQRSFDSEVVEKRTEEERTRLFKKTGLPELRELKAVRFQKCRCSIPDIIRRPEMGFLWTRLKQSLAEAINKVVFFKVTKYE